MARRSPVGRASPWRPVAPTISNPAVAVGRRAAAVLHRRARFARPAAATVWAATTYHAFDSNGGSDVEVTD